MVEGKRRSRSFRRVKVRIPSGKSVIHYVKRKPSKATCAECGAVLKGVARVRFNRLKKMPLTAKRPSRPFGGKLCSRCMRLEIIKRIKE